LTPAGVSEGKEAKLGNRQIFAIRPARAQYFLSSFATCRISRYDRRVANAIARLHPRDVDGSLIKALPSGEPNVGSPGGVCGAGREGIFCTGKRPE
jgi:hypothetical protein